MARHVVGPFVGMGEVGIVFRYESVEVVFEISSGRRIGIFHQYETAARVLAEHGCESVLDLALSNRAIQFIADFDRTLPSCMDLNFDLINTH